MNKYKAKLCEIAESLFKTYEGLVDCATNNRCIAFIDKHIGIIMTRSRYKRIVDYANSLQVHASIKLDDDGSTIIQVCRRLSPDCSVCFATCKFVDLDDATRRRLSYLKHIYGDFNHEECMYRYVYNTTRTNYTRSYFFVAGHCLFLPENFKCKFDY